MPSSRCRQCLLPARASGAGLDERGVCVYCRNIDPDAQAIAETVRRQHELDLERTLREARAGGQYDALVCLSGGKDSLYLLHRLKVEYRLNVLAFTTDINIPAIAWKNIERTIARLGC